MATATISLPEAQSQVSTISRNFTALVTPIIDRTIRGIFPPYTDDIYRSAVDLLRAADRFLFSIRMEQHEPDTEWANIRASARALRMAIYLEIIHFKPDQASYWSEEAQAHAANEDRGVDPARILPILPESEIAAAYADMAADEDYEREALEWSEGLIGETLE